MKIATGGLSELRRVQLTPAQADPACVAQNPGQLADHSFVQRDRQSPAGHLFKLIAADIQDEALELVWGSVPFHHRTGQAEMCPSPCERKGPGRIPAAKAAPLKKQPSARETMAANFKLLAFRN